MSFVYLLHHGIEASAESYPDSPAFRCWGAEVTYAELVTRANRLAQTLVAHGVQRHDRVGIYRTKGIESAIGIYGIWKAGAAYVPLDPSAPRSRIAWMMRDCGITHVVSEEAKRSDLAAIITEQPSSPNLHCVIGVAPGDDLPGVNCVTWDDVATAPAISPDVHQMEDDLAYLMYTSGSTGTPKGMMHTHRSGLAYARMSGSLYGVRNGDVLSNHAPLHFDISTFEYFTGPLHGATTLIIPEMYMLMPASLSKLMEDEQVTFWYSVPYALIQLEQRGVLEQRDLRSLRHVMYGGEPFPPKYLYALQQRWPHARFHNIYGPAEVNQCTYYEVPPLTEDHDEPIPIGTVCPNYEALILDHRDEPAEEGELAVRTASMMRGYWNRPDLNARVFYRRELLPQFEEVYLRTGDLVRRRPDGLLEFLGRKDRQIKVRGYRVELDEIESVLAAHPQVEEAAAFAVSAADSLKMVQAAVVLKRDAAGALPDLRAYSAKHLPHYAVPDHIRRYEAFPRTGTGKIDRRALQRETETSLERNQVEQ